MNNSASVSSQLTAQGLRLADPNGESGWYVPVMIDGRATKVWATELADGISKRIEYLRDCVGACRAFAASCRSNIGENMPEEARLRAFSDALESESIANGMERALTILFGQRD